MKKKWNVKINRQKGKDHHANFVKRKRIQQPNKN